MANSAHWAEISSDPNDPGVIRWRNEQLAASHRSPIPDRIAHLRGLAAGRDVLDVGVVEHQIDSAESTRWLHRHLVEVSATCRGVDILADEVAVLRERGFDVVVHDLVASPLDATFDLVVAGELIEHLDGPGPFLRNVATMLRPEGRLVLTTPNPYMLHRALKSMRGRFPDSADHAVLLGPGNVAELADRAGLRVDAWRGIRLKDLPGAKNRVATVARKALIACGFAPELACDSIVYELTRRPDHAGPPSSSGSQPA